MSQKEEFSVDFSLKKAFAPRMAVEAYDKNAKPAVDVDMSECKEEDKPRLVSILNRLAKSPCGLETLQIAKDHDFKFSFFEPGVRCFGACDELGNWVRLSPDATDDKLVGTLAHECRHAGQFARGAHEKFGVTDVRSEIISFRTMEADAQTYAVTSCKELALQGDDKPYQKFKETYPEIEMAFDAAYKKAGNQVNHDVMTATFDGWYDQLRTKTVYESSYQIEPMLKEIYDLKQGKEPTLFYNQGTISAKEALSIAGWTKEGNYYTNNPEQLESGKFLDVSERSMQDMKEFFKMRQELTGMAPDASLESIPVRANSLEVDRPRMGEAPPKGMFDLKDRILENKKNYVSEKRAAGENTSVKKAVAQKLAQKLAR